MPSRSTIDTMMKQAIPNRIAPSGTLKRVSEPELKVVEYTSTRLPQEQRIASSSRYRSVFFQ